MVLLKRLMCTVAIALAASACNDTPQNAAVTTSSRFAAAKRAPTAAASSFCEVQFPKGEARKPFVAPAARELPASLLTATAAPVAGKGWRWVNLWATWCHPCVEEMGLLTKWRDALRKDGVAIEMEMWSVDDDAPALEEFVKHHTLPGALHWMRASADLPATLSALGADPGSPIPVHALVDADNAVRCVRVGSVHEDDYGAIKALLSAG